MSTGQDLAGFGERLLAVIDEGRRTATYKLALLLALIDTCAQNVDHTGAAPAQLHTRTIARRVAELYWPQVRSYLADEDRMIVLLQIRSGRATILDAVQSLATKVGTVSFDRAEAADPEAFEAMLDIVELTVARYPLRLLQTVDNVAQPFIYDVNWTESVSLTRLRRDGWIHFRSGAGDQLIRLAPLVRPLVELHWTRTVAAWNKIALDEERLRRHLFGAERQAFPAKLRIGLAAITTALLACQ